MCYIFIFIWTVTLFWFKTTDANGRLAIHIVNYTNPKGTDVRGYCCDSNGNGCAPNICDPFFKICVSLPSQTSQQPCALADVRSGVYKNQNFIDFTKSLNNLSSLVDTSFQRWGGSVQMKITVVDDDSNEDLNDDTIGVLSGDVAIDVMNGPQTRMVKLDNHGIVVYVSVKSVCDANQYGTDCTVTCIPRNDVLGHFTCNLDGTKNCLPGWTGLNCDLLDFCSSSPCLNNGTCSNTPVEAKCSCVNNYKGIWCEISPYTTTSLPIQSSTPTETPSTTRLASTSQSVSTTVTTPLLKTTSTTTTRPTTMASIVTTTETTTSSVKSFITRHTKSPPPTTKLASSPIQPSLPTSTTSAKVQKGMMSANASNNGDGNNVAMIAGVGVVAAVVCFFGGCGISMFVCRQLQKKKRGVASKEETMKRNQDGSASSSVDHDTEVASPNNDSTPVSLPAWSNF